ncbi:SWIM zinc finger family protein [Cellulophaga sp. HaHa_2_95]|uniref:SWIM zinc finger family protein n=1 Tax=Cellulophaga sp. HaHa_2_95 TaxID=2745558 RepID=UPI001C4EB72D|nr:SWIM zinc finger family protein [Cellulophaga sp. HaHa_2_95]QXP54620.1 SWIM zinc finger family protein [Cellulophaga sp. HaHa_2_95]
MKFNYKYSGTSNIVNDISSTGVSFAPDILREPTYFVGSLDKKLPFREAISALHEVVVADFNFQPKDNSEYLAWLKNEETNWIAEASAELPKIKYEIRQLQGQLKGLREQREEITRPFYKSQKEYFKYIYTRDYAAWLVLDPVITVHPDQVFFECFSKDESVYGKLSCGLDVFNNINEFKCGTTNIDYSQKLYNEFQKIRTYKDTEFKIDPKGFDVQTSGEESYREVKIDLPDSWVRGFLQVSSAMTSDKVSFDLHPIDIANFIAVLKRNKEKKGPRAIKYILKPGQPIVAVFEPWNIEVACLQSIYTGHEAKEIRVWGRRRIQLLERLLPITGKFTVHLLGTGMPSFYIAHLANDMYFTLGLSGWTANDWSQATQLDLLAPRGKVPATTMQTIYLELRKDWLNTEKGIANKLNLDVQTVKQSLETFTQAGKVIYDLKNEVYRVRELKREGIDLEELRFSSSTDKEAYQLMENGEVRNLKSEVQNDKIEVTAVVSNSFKTTVVINKDLQITDGKCNCNYYYMNKMTKGPCEHILATRISFDKK